MNQSDLSDPSVPAIPLSQMKDDSWMLANQGVAQSMVEELVKTIGRHQQGGAKSEPRKKPETTSWPPGAVEAFNSEITGRDVHQLLKSLPLSDLPAPPWVSLSDPPTRDLVQILSEDEGTLFIRIEGDRRDDMLGDLILTPEDAAQAPSQAEIDEKVDRDMAKILGVPVEVVRLQRRAKDKEGDPIDAELFRLFPRLKQVAG